MQPRAEEEGGEGEDWEEESFTKLHSIREADLARFSFSAAELCCAVEKVGRRYSESECECLVAELDTDHDGFVDMHEFIYVVDKAPPSTASAGLF